MKTYYVALCMTVEAPDEKTARLKMNGWVRKVKFPDSVKHREITLVEEAAE